MALLRAREAAEYLNVSLATLYRIEREGNLTPFRTSGGHRRYSLAMLNEYLERSRQRFLSERSAAKGTPNAPAKNPHNKKVRILVVDCEPEIMELIVTALQEGNDIYEFASASNSYEVGVQVVVFKPNLIFLDMTGLGISGCEICKQIKSTPETAHIKVVGIVEPGDSETIEGLLSSGVDDCLIKPLQAEEIQRSVHYIL